MKKLMIAAAIVCAAVVSQAASVAWSTGTMYFDGDESLLKDSGGTKVTSATAWLFELTSAQYALLTSSADIWAAAGEGKTLTASYETSSIKVGSDTINAFDRNDEVINGDIALFEDGDNYSQGDNVYAAIIVTTEDGDGNKFYSANTFEGVVGQKGLTVSGAALGWGDMAGGAATEWTAVESVPEPFSGALCLLGMGAIALRRKLRKAKKA